MSEGYTVLCVVAHPADMVTECGGTLAVHAERGDRVAAVVLTHGGRIHPIVYVEASRKRETDSDGAVAEAERARVIEIKHAEIESAAGILGIHEVIYLDHESPIYYLRVRHKSEYVQDWASCDARLLKNVHRSIC